MSRLATPRTLALLVLLLAVGLRLLVWVGPLHQLANDEVEYVTVARDLLAGRGWEFYTSYPWLRAPLYNLWLAGSLWLAGGDLHRAALPNLLLSIANVGLAGLLGQRLFGWRAGLLAALITALLWTNVTFASLYMAETLFTFWFQLALLLLLGPRSAERGPFWRNGLLAAVLAGVCFGLAMLTRSAGLPFAPLAALWLVLRWRQAGRGWRAALLPALAFGLALALTIAPWAVRNQRAYGRLILVETGLGYNMWAFNEPRESLGEIGSALSAIPNPAERNDYAMAQGMARLREDPAILLRKIWPNWTYLTRVKPIEDRFVLESYYLDVRLPQFSAGLLLDDALYLLIALGGIAGLALAGGSRGWLATLAAPRTLALAWLLPLVGTMLLTHGEGRYRHFLFPLLVPYAAWALLVLLKRERPAQRPALLPCAAAGVAALALLAAFGPTYPYDWAGSNLARGWRQFGGDLALAVGNNSAALDAYRRADAGAKTTDSALELGNLARANGLDSEAEAAYRKSYDRARLWVAPSAALGDLLRAQGRNAEAQDAFDGFHADEAAMLDWSWRHLAPERPARLDVGSGLDFGLIDGVYDAEAQQDTTLRWTNGRALIRLAPRAAPTLVQVRLAAPNPEAATEATLCAENTCRSFPVEPLWRVYTLWLPAGDGPLELRSPTFSSGDGRTLGLMIDWIEQR